MAAAEFPHGWLLRTWGEEAVAFDTASGDTHYLRPMTLALYQICCDNPNQDARQIAALLAVHQGTPLAPQLVEDVDEGLSSLRRIGLLQVP